MSRLPALAIVMPAFNEESRIGKVVEDWAGACERLGIDYIIHVYDAGSTDGTRATLENIARERPGRIVTSIAPGLPHGPAVVRGYREATADWVFQCDSDDAIGPEAFGDLWDRRLDFDLLLGRRQGRRSNVPRRIVTMTSRWCVRALFGSPVSDANGPYRLIRRSALEGLLTRIPENAVAPNVLVSGLAGMHRLRVYETDVRDRGDPTGTAGLVRLELWRRALLAFAQTARVRFRG